MEFQLRVGLKKKKVQVKVQKSFKSELDLNWMYEHVCMCAYDVDSIIVPLRKWIKYVVQRSLQFYFSSF